MPKEFTKLSAQDLGKVGAIQDLLRGIEKILGKKRAETVTATEPQRYVSEAESKTVSILKRGYMALEDGEWDKADKFFEEVLNYDAENAQAYLGKLLAELRVRRESELKNCDVNFENNSNYQRTLKFADDALKRELEGYCATARKKADEVRSRSEEASRKRRKQFSVIVPAVIACIALIFVITKVIVPTSKLKSARVRLVRKWQWQYSNVRCAGELWRFSPEHLWLFAITAAVRRRYRI